MANGRRESAISRTNRLPIKRYKFGDDIVIRHWSGYHTWIAKLLEVNSKYALLDLGPQQGVVQMRMTGAPKHAAGTFLKGMKGWHVDLGQLERLKATAKEGLQEDE